MDKDALMQSIQSMQSIAHAAKTASKTSFSDPTLRAMQEEMAVLDVMLRRAYQNEGGVDAKRVQAAYTALANARKELENARREMENACRKPPNWRNEER